jgi:hypothetical protein
MVDDPLRRHPLPLKRHPRPLKHHPRPLKRHPRACPGDLPRYSAGTGPRDEPGDDACGRRGSVDLGSAQQLPRRAGHPPQRHPRARSGDLARHFAGTGPRDKPGDDDDGWARQLTRLLLSIALARMANHPV